MRELPICVPLPAGLGSLRRMISALSETLGTALAPYADGAPTGRGSTIALVVAFAILVSMGVGIYLSVRRRQRR